MNKAKEKIITELSKEAHLSLQAPSQKQHDEIEKFTADLINYTNEITELKRLIFGVINDSFVIDDSSPQLKSGWKLPDPL